MAILCCKSAYDKTSIPINLKKSQAVEYDKMKPQYFKRFTNAIDIIKNKVITQNIPLNRYIKNSRLKVHYLQGAYRSQ